MKHYLDTSALVALFDPLNPHHKSVLQWQEKHDVNELAYNRLLQVESRQYFRRMTHAYAATARQAHTAAEKTKRLAWQALNFTSVLQQAEDFSRRNSPLIQCGFWDLCHVLAAETEITFVTCDERQAEAARIAGLQTTHIKT